MLRSRGNAVGLIRVPARSIRGHGEVTFAAAATEMAPRND
jgi:hypothetical protein